MKNIGIKLGTLGLLATTIFAPMSASADAHRQDNRNIVRTVVVSVLNNDVQYDNNCNDRGRDLDRRRDDRDRGNDRDHRDDRGNDSRNSRR
jgi:hypothetical protein